MSYDLMVFDPSAAPRERTAFMAWYQQQAQWSEPHDYNDPEAPSERLRAWFREMIETFPPMNGPLARNDDDSPKVTDYSLGSSVIYAAFAWSEAEMAYHRMFVLAARHHVGFFDVSSAVGDLWFPTADGQLERDTMVTLRGWARLRAWVFPRRP